MLRQNNSPVPRQLVLALIRFRGRNVAEVRQCIIGLVLFLDRDELDSFLIGRIITMAVDIEDGFVIIQSEDVASAQQPLYLDRNKQGC